MEVTVVSWWWFLLCSPPSLGSCAVMNGGRFCNDNNDSRRWRYISPPIPVPQHSHVSSSHSESLLYIRSNPTSSSMVGTVERNVGNLTAVFTLPLRLSSCISLLYVRSTPISSSVDKALS